MFTEKKWELGEGAWLPLLIFFIGAFVRSYQFWVPPLWLDEYVTWWVVSGATWAETVKRATETQGQSPVYYLIVRLVTEFAGVGPFQLRLPSVVFGVATLAVIYPLAIRIFNNRHVAIGSLALFAAYEKLIWYSQNARPYSMALLFTVLSFLYFLRILEHDKVSNRIGHILTTGLACYSHFLFSFVFIIQVSYLLSTREWGQVINKRWLFTVLSMAVFCLPLFNQFIHLFARRHELNWLSPFDSSGISVMGLDVTSALFHPWVLFSLLLALMSVCYRRQQIRQNATEDWMFLLLLWLLLPILCFRVIPSWFDVKLFDLRYILFTLPAGFFLLAWQVVRVAGGHPHKRVVLYSFLGITFLAMIVPNLSRSGTFARWIDEPWVRVAQFIGISARCEDAVVFRTGLVEADLLARSRQQPLLTSYLSWPLEANFSSAPCYSMIGLPYRLATETRDYFESVLLRAAKRNNVWVVGVGKLTPFFANQLASVKGYEIIAHSAYGEIELFQLQRR